MPGGVGGAEPIGSPLSRLALENGHFVGQLLDDRITVRQCPLLVLDTIEQFRGKGTELIGRELVEIGALSHAR